MAEAFLKSFDRNFVVYSAGTFPSKNVHPLAIKVMKEEGIDISQNNPKSVDIYLKETFDYVITVCDDAKETCPVFTGKVKKRLHIGFEDPAKAKGSEEEKLAKFRQIREQIKKEFSNFYLTYLKEYLEKY